MALTPSKPSSSPSLTENPISSRSQKHSSRSSEVSDPMRRSFSGSSFARPSIVANPRGFNPVTPANSPSDFAARGRESIRFTREHEEKENGRDPNPKKMPTKLPSLSKGTKNFMSPTISAASKVNASPSKKILTERNSEQAVQIAADLRSSCSSMTNLSEILEESETKTDMEPEQKGPKKKVAFDSVVHTIPPVVPDPLQESGSDVDESTVAETSPNLKPSCPYLAPLDADPFTPMSPYDPKTNYLAPRPKFLYYKPRPPMEHSLDGEMDGNPLDDGFFSDSYSETGATEETESNSLPSESEDVSSELMMAKEEEVVEAIPVSEPDLLCPEIGEEAAVGEKKVPRSQFLTLPKCIFSVLILLLACSAMMGASSQIKSYSMIRVSSFSMVLDVVPKETEHMRTSTKLLGENFRLWSDNSVMFIFRLISQLRRGEHQFGSVSFLNLTVLDETPWYDRETVYGSLITDGSESDEIFDKGVQIEAEDMEEEENAWEFDETEVEEENLQEGSESGGEGPVEVSDEVSERESEQEHEHQNLSAEEEHMISTEEKIQEQSELEVVQSETDTQTELVSIIIEKNEILPPSSEFEVPQSTESSSLETDGALLENSISKKVEIPVATAEIDVPQSIERVEMEVAFLEEPQWLEAARFDNMFTQRMVRICSVIVPIAAVVALIYFKKRKSCMNIRAQTEAQAEPLVAKKFNVSPVSGNLLTEFDVVGDSCPSEISSFPRESSFESKGLEKVYGEARNYDRKPARSFRRESLASSSSDMSIGGSPSASYGSFTTYEMIPSNRNGEEELVITPLRRSSRLRK